MRSRVQPYTVPHVTLCQPNIFAQRWHLLMWRCRKTMWAHFFSLFNFLLVCMMYDACTCGVYVCMCVAVRLEFEMWKASLSYHIPFAMSVNGMWYESLTVGPIIATSLAASVCECACVSMDTSSLCGVMDNVRSNISCCVTRRLFLFGRRIVQCTVHRCRDAPTT